MWLAACAAIPAPGPLRPGPGGRLVAAFHRYLCPQPYNRTSAVALCGEESLDLPPLTRTPCGGRGPPTPPLKQLLSCTARPGGNGSGVQAGFCQAAGLSGSIKSIGQSVILELLWSCTAKRCLGGAPRRTCRLGAVPCGLTHGLPALLATAFASGGGACIVVAVPLALREGPHGHARWGARSLGVRMRAA